ncbi:MAG: SUMF1/EgtB/PvdO family nonheme iron enzyme, partial [Phycisphaeraceae bacterium]
MRRHFAALLVLAFISPVARAADLPTAKEHVNTLGMKLVRIEPGHFKMGEGEAPPATKSDWLLREYDEAPAHRVTLTKPFYIGAHEVTVGQYDNFNPAHRKLRAKGRDDHAPVTFVTWHEAAAYCDWLSKKEGLPYRLPREAEWEFVCRAGTTTRFVTGDEIKPTDANYGVTEQNAEAKAMPVGKFPANPWGIFDMHGNVEEWCADWYGQYEAGEQRDPVGRVDGIIRVSRGGSYTSKRVAESKEYSARYVRSSNRAGHLPEDATVYLGFRVVLGDRPETKPLPVAAPPLNQRDVNQTPPVRKRTPDPALPYFRNFTKEKATAEIPKETWGPVFSQWNHFAAVTVCPNGDVLAAWYTCVSESGRELSLAASRLRSGTSGGWEPASLFLDVPDMNDHAPVLVSDGKRVFHFCLQATRGWDSASIIMRSSDDSGATWSKPRIILSRDEPNRLSQPCSAFVATDGTIVLAVDGDNHRDERLMTSKDGGATWRIGKGDMRKAAGAYAIHPASVPLKDGSILTFLRGPHPMAAFVTKDWGDTFEPMAVPFPGIGVGQKAAALRLKSGAILLVSLDNKKELVGGGTLAALSLDEGKTWPHVRKV